MGKVVYIKDYRRGLRRQYLAKNQARIDKFIARFITLNFPIDFQELSYRYLDIQRQNDAITWDYIDLRDILHDAIELAYGDELQEALAKEFWYRDNYLSFDEVLDRCLSYYILGQSKTAEAGPSQR